METKPYRYTANSPDSVEAALQYVPCADGWCVTAGTLPPADGTVGRGITVPEEIDGIPVTELNISWRGSFQFIAGPLLRRATIRILPSLFRARNTFGRVLVHAPLDTLTISSGDTLELGLHSDTLRVLRLNAPGIRIPEKGFCLCPSLQAVHFTGTVTDLGMNAFEYCRHLTQVSLPPDIAAIPAYCFYNCSALEQIRLPDALRQIGTGAFAACSRLKLTHLPSGLTGIGARAFYGVSLPSPLLLPPGIVTLGNQALGVDQFLVIRGLPGTAAERYAAAHGLSFLPITRAEDRNFHL